MDKRLRW